MKQRGFTLIEGMIVLVSAAIITVIVLGVGTLKDAYVVSCRDHGVMFARYAYVKDNAVHLEQADRSHTVITGDSCTINQTHDRKKGL